MHWLLFSHHPSPALQHGFNLVELSVVLGLLAISASWAMPMWSQWLWRLQVETVVQAWGGDLQTARLQALRRGQGLQLQRLNNCQSTPLNDGDWRCGWQIVMTSNSKAPPLWTHALKGEVLVQLNPKQNQVPVNAQGDIAAGGLRIVVQAQGLKAMVRSICINNTGRLRVVSAATCT